MIEVSAVTGLPLDVIETLDWSDLATYVDALTPPQRGKHRG